MRKIISISDFHGRKYVEDSKTLWEMRGCKLIEKDYETVVAENDFYKYSLVTLTMNHHNCPKFHKYAEDIRELTNIPIVIFPYGDDFPANDMSDMAKDADELMPLPMNIELAIQNCISLMNISDKVLVKPSTVICEDGINLDIGKYTATVDSKVINLTKTECNILYFLIKNRNQIMTYRQIYRNVWGEEYCDNAHNILWNQINNLRRKLQWNNRIANFIVTKRGVGYMFNPQ